MFRCGERKTDYRNVPVPSICSLISQRNKRYTSVVEELTTRPAWKTIQKMKPNDKGNHLHYHRQQRYNHELQEDQTRELPRGTSSFLTSPGRTWRAYISDPPLEMPKELMNTPSLPAEPQHTRQVDLNCTSQQ